MQRIFAAGSISVSPIMALLLLPFAAGTHTATRTCIPARIHHGAPPAWVATASAHSTPRPPYALTTDSDVAAFFQINDLRAGDSTDPSNKVLWIVRYARHGHPLRIAARWDSNRGMTVRSVWPADSNPGQIYPTAINLPYAGCWTLTLAWGIQHANIDVSVHPH